MLNETRWVEDIGMPAVDRPISETCIHATEFCRATCYNNKLMQAFPRIHEKDVRNEEFWQQLDGDQLRAILGRSRNFQQMGQKRFRLMTRGEPFKDFADVNKVRDLALKNPDVLFWIPTRAWRHPLLRLYIERQVKELHNVRLLASMDPSNTPEEWEDVKLSGWSTMFYGADDMTVTPNGDRMFLCPKTHKKLKGHCGICKAGCFKPQSKGRVDVHLSRH
jgi:hypothetical protein